MSYCYDVMERKWEELRAQLPDDVRDGEMAVRFGFLIADMHEANHRLRDAINHDVRVTKAASNLDKTGPLTSPVEDDERTCKHCGCAWKDHTCP